MEPITDQNRERYRELARRLYAAWMSHRMCLSGVDYCMKTYASKDEPIGDLWIEIARKVEGFVSEQPLYQR